jgi:hypothetical protein
MLFSFVTVVPEYLNFAALSINLLAYVMIMSLIVVSRYEHGLFCFCIYAQAKLLTST